MKMVGSRVNYFRNKRGLTLKELAEGICNESTLLRIEKGQQNPRLDLLALLSSKLGIPINYLISPDDHEEMKYINRVKQICREIVNNQEYEALFLILSEAEDKKEIDLKVHEELSQFIVWYKAIYTHMYLKDTVLAEKMLLEIFPKHNHLISETDIGIANSLGLVYLEQKKWEEALELFRNGFNAIEHLPALDDKMLYVRVGYNYALTNYYLENYAEVIHICYKLIYYLDLHKLFYLSGRLNHLLGITFEKVNNLLEAENHMRKAAEIFLAESKQYYHLKALRALSEILFKAVKIDEGKETLDLVENQLRSLPERNDLLELIKETRKIYLHEDIYLS